MIESDLQASFKQDAVIKLSTGGDTSVLLAGLVGERRDTPTDDNSADNDA